MSEALTTPPRKPHATFMNFPLHTDLATLEADVAILGIPYGDPYTIDEVTNDQTNAPTAVRVASARFSQALDRFDFDVGGTLFDGRPVRVVDCGDVAGDHADLKGHYRRAEAAARLILERGALPVVIGGDHGVPIPVFRAFEGRGPITLVHIDAHLDWRDEVNGAHEGYSSPIRRAAELDWFEGIFQIGIRAQGSARETEVEDALAYGAHIITSYEVHEQGMGAVLERIPDGGSYYLTIDADGMDPTEMPAVAAPAPGGVLYHQTRQLIHGLAAKGRLVGMDIVEITPKRDLNEITAITAGRLIFNLIGATTRAGYFD
jgi:agmatinase